MAPTMKPPSKCKSCVLYKTPFCRLLDMRIYPRDCPDYEPYEESEINDDDH